MTTAIGFFLELV